MNYRLDVMSLREHIKCAERVKRISACNYFAKIARQRRRIARHVADLLWTKLQDSVNNSRLGAGAQVSQAKLSLSDTALHAPFTGFVTARNIVKGSLVGNSTVGFSLIDTHVVKAEFAIPDTSLHGVRLGQRMNMTLDALQQPVAGIVTAISPQADAKSRVFSVDLTIANPRNQIRPGMIGSLSLAADAHPARRLAIPLSAVVRAPDSPHEFAVFRIETRGGNNYAAAQPIQIGNTYGNAIEVTRRRC